jgi:hypothetical protein
MLNRLRKIFKQIPLNKLISFSDLDHIFDYLFNTKSIFKGTVDFTDADVIGLDKSNTGGLEWSDIDNKPSVFPPEDHIHTVSDIIDLVIPNHELTLTSGFNFEIELDTVTFNISKCTFYSPTGNNVSVFYRISDKVYIESNINLLNHTVILT